MSTPRFLEEIGTRLSEVLAKSPAQDVEKNVRALLTTFFERFDLVTRDDFEVQKRILERTMGRIAELEARLGKVEANRASSSSANDSRE
jgi:ubiquinone biosynthesis accessory factor UbiK